MNTPDQKKAVRLLHQIAKFLNEDDSSTDQSRAHFWLLLTALRGSDCDQNEAIKMAFTAPLRAALGIREMYHEAGPQLQIITSKGKRPLTAKEAKLSEHFYTHYDGALRAYEALFNKPFYDQKEKKS